MSFDFFAAVKAPFRMQPGLRRMAAGAPHLCPLPAGSRHQREKLAVLSAFWHQALLQRPGFDAQPALHALCRHAAAEHPAQPWRWRWDGHTASADWLGVSVQRDGTVTQLGAGQFGLGDELSRCLQGLPPPWRLAGLLSLAFAEDLAVMDGGDGGDGGDGRGGSIPWLAVALPSHWAPEQKVGRHFSEIHAPVADNTLLLRAADGLMRLVTGGAGTATPPERWERFVWNVSDHPRLHAHPARVDPQRWQHTPVEQAWFRSERQTFIPVPGQSQAVFTIQVQVQRLREVLATPAHAQALHDAVASMSPAVLAYRSLAGVRDALLAWLAAQAALPGESEAAQPPAAGPPAAHA